MVALYKQQLGELIREMREGLGLTQKQLADRSHVAESQTVSRWERGERAPQDLESVAVALETTVPEILRRLEPLGQRQRKAMHADAGRTQLDRIEALLEETRLRDEKYAELIDTQNTLLARQSEILEGIERLLSTQLDAARQMEEAAAMMRAVDPLPPAPPVVPSQTRRRAS